jgi:hypothetical protein
LLEGSGKLLFFLFFLNTTCLSFHLQCPFALPFFLCGLVTWSYLNVGNYSQVRWLRLRSDQDAPAAFCPGKDGAVFALEMDLLSVNGIPVFGSNRIFDTFVFSRALINRGWFSRFVYVALKPDKRLIALSVMRLTQNCLHIPTFWLLIVLNHGVDIIVFSLSVRVLNSHTRTAAHCKTQ